MWKIDSNFSFVEKNKDKEIVPKQCFAGSTDILGASLFLPHW